MAAVVLRNYGGMAPASVTTANNPAVARLVRNLDLRQSDFRPFPQAQEVGPPMTPGSTLYRFEKTGYWITRPAVVNFVRGPIPNDATERTYYTGDGAPKVTDDTGAIRQLGVPAPTHGPPLVVHRTPQYSTDDAAAAQGQKLTEIMEAVRASYTWEWTGLTGADLDSRFDAAPAPAYWSYRFRVPGVLAGGIFTPANPSHINLVDDRLQWGLETRQDGAVAGFAAVDVRSQHIVFHGNLANALGDIADPSDPAKKLLTAAQVETFTNTLLDALAPAAQVRDIAIDRLREAKNKYVALADTGSVSAAATVSSVKAFYETPHTVAIIDNAVETAATAILNAIQTFQFPAYTDPGNGGSGGGYTTPRNPPRSPDYYEEPM